MKEKLRQLGLEDKSGGLRRKVSQEVKCSRGAKALRGHKEGKGNETRRKRREDSSVSLKRTT